MSTRAMTLIDQVIHNNKDQWLAEGIEKGKQLGISEGKEMGISEGKELGISEGIAQSTKSTILNAFDYGIKISVIRAITGETEEKIYSILRENERNI